MLSARAMDRARAAGLPDVVLETMLQFRDAEQGLREFPGELELWGVLRFESACLVDEVLVWRIRKFLTRKSGHSL